MKTILYWIDSHYCSRAMYLEYPLHMHEVVGDYMYVTVVNRFAWSSVVIRGGKL